MCFTKHLVGVNSQNLMSCHRVVGVNSHSVNHQLKDKLTLLQNLDGEILELVPVGEVEDEIMEADVISNNIVDLREQIVEFMAKSRVSDKSTELSSDPIVDEAMEPVKSPMQAKAVYFCSKTADVALPTVQT